MDAEKILKECQRKCQRKCPNVRRRFATNEIPCIKSRRYKKCVTKCFIKSFMLFKNISI